LGAHVLNNQTIDEKFLILGHKGFLGQSVYNSLINNGNAVTTVSSRIDLKDITSEYFANDTVVINCIASGVTPYTSDEDTDILTNAKLLEGLLEFFVKSRSSRFIHFGSIYEIDIVK
jgi:nucleoside-diphosphate-sugar epimerase